MAMQERQQPQAASFSSSLLDAIYHSFDEAGEAGQEPRGFTRNEADMASLRRAIMVENWMESLGRKRINLRSASLSDSSILLSDMETTSSALRSSRKAKTKVEKKEPISPCGRIAHFLNSIFSPRNLARNRGVDAWGGQIRKSRSMKDTRTTTTTTTTTTASKSCLSKNPSAGGSKSKRSVRFTTDIHNIHENDERSAVGSRFIKKNIDDLRFYEEKNAWGHDCFRSGHEHEEDNMSCSSSDLFELDNIGHAGKGTYQEELPVYGTTYVKVNQTIA